MLLADATVLFSEMPTLFWPKRSLKKKRKKKQEAQKKCLETLQYKRQKTNQMDEVD